MWGDRKSDDELGGYHPSDRHNGFRISVEDLEKTIQAYDSGKSQEALTAQLGGFLSLSRKIASLTISLDNEMSVQGETL